MLLYRYSYVRFGFDQFSAYSFSQCSHGVFCSAIETQFLHRHTVTWHATWNTHFVQWHSGAVFQPLPRSTQRPGYASGDNGYMDIVSLLWISLAYTAGNNQLDYTIKTKKQRHIYTHIYALTKLARTNKPISHCETLTIQVKVLNYTHLFISMICPSSMPHSLISFNDSLVHVQSASTFTW